MSQNVDLQSEDYYKKEINYQEEISQQQAANSLIEKIELLEQDDFIVVQLPDSLSISSVQVDFIRPNNDKHDLNFRINDTKSYLISKEKLTPGKYLIEIRYQVNGKDCLQKTELYI